jgi:hypothetical protein
MFMEYLLACLQSARHTFPGLPCPSPGQLRRPVQGDLGMHDVSVLGSWRLGDVHAFHIHWLFPFAMIHGHAAELSAKDWPSWPTSRKNVFTRAKNSQSP